MNDDDEPRELVDYDPSDPSDRGTGPWERRRRALRLIALIALVGMIVPTAIGTYSTARSTAAQSCRAAVDFYAAPDIAARVAFEILSLDAIGWNCYAVLPRGEILIAPLGLIPGPARLVPRTLS